MFKKTTFILIVAAVAVVAYLLGAAGAEPALQASGNADIDARLSALEAAMAQQDEEDADQEEAFDPTAHLVRIADALSTLAENSAHFESMATSLQQVSERLAGIEEELAWRRLDAESEGN
jgi:uncharacterized coiled-coil protein SlyX